MPLQVAVLGISFFFSFMTFPILENPLKMQYLPYTVQVYVLIRAPNVL